MKYIADGFKESIDLLLSLNPELYQIVALSLIVSATATILGVVLFTPLGIITGICDFPGKGLVSRCVYTLMSTPTVVIGLLAALIFTRNGPLGFLDLMYTPKIMIIAQFLLVGPLVMGLAMDVGKNSCVSANRLAITLGATGIKKLLFLIRQVKGELIVVCITAFSRAISEVGAVMVVGGNIKGYTRVMTTSISMLNSMGEYGRAIALGIVLFAISFIINAITYSWSKKY